MRLYYENEHGQLYHGDCLEVMGTLAEARGRGWADMVLCDPPYGTTACPWDAVVPFKSMWEELNKAIPENRAVILTASQPFTTALAASNLPALKYCWYWDKKFAGNFVQAKRMPLKTVEDVLVFSFGGKHPLYRPQLEARETPIYKGGNAQSSAIPIARTANSDAFEKERKRYDKKQPTTLLQFSVRDGRGLHPTQKPVPLFAYLIATYTDPGETVLDFCAGSGTAAVAAQQLGRKWVLIEKEEKYCEVIAKRLEDPKSFQIKNATNISIEPVDDEAPTLGTRFMTALEKIAGALERRAAWTNTKTSSTS